MNKYFEKIKTFIDSKYFTIVMSAIIVFCHTFDLFNLSIILLSIVASLILITKANIMNVFMPVCLALIGNEHNANPKSPMFYIALATLTAPVVLLIIDIIRNKLKIRNKIFLSTALLILCAFISLINTPSFSDSFNGIKTLGIFLASTIYFSSRIYDKKSAFNIFCYMFMWIGMVVFLQMQIYLLKDASNMFKLIKDKQIMLGWGISNHYVGVLILSFIATFYLLYISKKWLYIIPMIVNTVAIVLTMSRGGYLAFAVIVVMMFLAVLYYAKDKKQIIKYYIIAGVSGLVLLFIFYQVGLLDKFMDLIFSREINNDVFAMNGRTPVYNTAIRRFKNHILIGNGLFSSHYYMALDINAKLYFYHNYILQTMSDLGILGLIAFGYFIFTIVKPLFKKNIASTALLMMIVYYLVHGLLDTTFYLAFLMIILSFIVVFSVVEDKVDIEKELDLNNN